MLLRITAERAGDSTVVHVAGRLAGAGVEELGRLCATASRPLRIDLSGMLQADELGLGLLRSLRASGVELAGPSVFIAMLLDDRSLRAPN